jgi:hypothetical protein
MTFERHIGRYALGSLLGSLLFFGIKMALDSHHLVGIYSNLIML